MATMSIANPSREQVIKREGPLIEKAMAHYKRVARLTFDKPDLGKTEGVIEYHNFI